MDYLYDESTVFIILFFVAFFASLIDSIAGGGGLLTTPSMLLLGISPLNVLATNKFQSCFGTFTSTYNYYKNGLLTERKRVLYFVLSFVGSSTFIHNSIHHPFVGVSVKFTAKRLSSTPSNDR